jgi:chromosome partitioning protein
VHPSPYDVWAAKEIVDLITEVWVIKTDLKAVFAVNRKIIGAAIGRDVAAALASYPVPVLETAISQWVGFAESAAEGPDRVGISPISTLRSRFMCTLLTGHLSAQVARAL